MRCGGDCDGVCCDDGKTEFIEVLAACGAKRSTKVDAFMRRWLLVMR